MKILTVEKDIIELDDIKDYTNFPKTQFTVVDLGSDSNMDGTTDIIFPRLVFIEEFIGPALKCQVGPYETIIPLAWFTFIGEEEMGEIEPVAITSINARDFSTVVSDPISGFRHHFMPVRAIELYVEYQWSLPKIKKGQVLPVPLSDKNDKDCLCMYICPSKSKIPSVVYAGDFV